MCSVPRTKGKRTEWRRMGQRSKAPCLKPWPGFSVSSFEFWIIYTIFIRWTCRTNNSLVKSKTLFFCCLVWSTVLKIRLSASQAVCHKPPLRPTSPTVWVTGNCTNACTPHMFKSTLMGTLKFSLEPCPDRRSEFSTGFFTQNQKCRLVYAPSVFTCMAYRNHITWSIVHVQPKWLWFSYWSPREQSSCCFRILFFL